MMFGGLHLWCIFQFRILSGVIVGDEFPFDLEVQIRLAPSRAVSLAVNFSFRPDVIVYVWRCAFTIVQFNFKNTIKSY